MMIRELTKSKIFRLTVPYRYALPLCDIVGFNIFILHAGELPVVIGHPTMTTQQNQPQIPSLADRYSSCICHSKVTHHCCPMKYDFPLPRRLGSLISRDLASTTRISKTAFKCPFHVQTGVYNTRRCRRRP